MKRPSRQFWERIQSTVRVLDQRSYYQLLDITQDARGDTVVDAYYRLVKLIHPDRHARERDRGRKRALVKLYARVGEAFRVLSDPGKRSAYDDALASGVTRLPPEDKSKQRELVDQRDPRTAQGRQLFERGQQQMAERNYRGARAQLQLANQLEPDSRAIAALIAQLDELQRLPRPKASAAPPPTPARAAPAPAPAPAPAAGDGVVVPSAPDPDDNAYARRHTRYEVKRPVTVACRTWEKLEHLYSHDISRGGIFLRTTKLLPVGQLLELTLSLPDGRTIRLSGAVAHVVPPSNPPDRQPGLGIRFDEMSVEQRADIEAMLAGAKRWDDSVVRELPAAGESSTRLNAVDAAHVSSRALLERDPLADGPDDAAVAAARQARDCMIEGDYASAVALLRTAVQPNPKNRRLRAAYHLARAYEARASHRGDEATKQFRVVLKYDPRCLEAIKALRRPHSADQSLKIRRALVNRLVGKNGP